MPAEAVFGSVGVMPAMIEDTIADQMDYAAELELACAEPCVTIDEVPSWKESNDLDDTVWKTIEKLEDVEEIKRNVIEQGKRNMTSQHLDAENDEEQIAAWMLDFDGIHQDFKAIVSNIYPIMMEGQEGDNSRNLMAETSIPGEPLHLPSKTFGRDELIENIVGLAKGHRFTPIALIGAGGIGKTSIALDVLHHDRIKQRFGHDRRFIRCDQFPRSCANLLRRLSDVTGAGVESPEDLAPLRPALSSKEMMIVLDNAESILDPRGTDAREIYEVVEELCRFRNLWICITSRISIIPIECKCLDIPTLSMDAACDTFYRIYDSGDARSEPINDVLKQLDFHPLSITLLAKVAQENGWDTNRLTRKWTQWRTRVLKTKHNESLASAIELSLSSGLFQKLGPNARTLLEIVAFFPQGINEENLDWLFPTISKRAKIFDTFCMLSLTYRSNGFVTMLAPFRDHLSPKDPKASPLLCAARDHYFTRMSVRIDPHDPDFGEMRWIVSEVANVERLLNVFTTIDKKSDDVWSACARFMGYLIRALIWVFRSVGNGAKHKRLLSRALGLWRERRSGRQVAKTSVKLSEANWHIGLHKEGIQQAEEVLVIYERLGDTAGRANYLVKLAGLFESNEQLDAAEEAASRAIALLPEQGEQYWACQSHRTLGGIYQSKGEIEKAIHHYKIAIGIASSFNWHGELFWAHYGLAVLFRIEGRFDDAQTHIEHAKSHTANDAYHLGVATEEQVVIWYEQDRFEEARSEALRAADIYEKLGAAEDLEDCRELLWDIEEDLNNPAASLRSGL